MSTPSALLGLEIQTLLRVCESVGSDRALAVSLLVSNGRFGELLDLPLDFDVDDPVHFALDYFVTAFLRKSPNIPLGVDRRKEALCRFESGEAQCAETNKRLLNPSIVEPEWVRRFEKVLSLILGPLRGSDSNPEVVRKSGTPLEQIMSLCHHGKGACVGLRGKGLVSSEKYDTIPSCTPRLVRFAKSLMGPLWHDANSNRGLDVVRGSEWTNVPKNARTDRGIAKEPLLNMFLQLGIGEYLVKRLKRFGVDLTDQSRNQELAGLAYSKGLATLDLSNASDTLAWSVILRYFPEDWVDILWTARSDYCRVDGLWVELEKLSSMGNGFTFPVETLVFAAVIYSLVPMEEQCLTGIYGDDLIVPAQYAPAVITALEFLGFSVNTSKSFLGGKFFESCGTDWFMGEAVQPLYARGTMDDPIPYALHLANELRLFAGRLNAISGVGGCSQILRPTWEWLAQQVPAPWSQCYGPPEYGDSVLITGELEGVIGSLSDLGLKQAYERGVERGWEGFAIRHVIIEMLTVARGTPGVLLNVLSRGLIPEDAESYDRRRGNTFLYPALARSYGKEQRRGMYVGPKTRTGWAHAWPTQDWL